MLRPIEGPVTLNQEEMTFLTTLIGVTHDQGLPQPGGLILPDSISGEGNSEKNQLMSLEKLFEDKVPELKLGGEPWDYNIKANVRLIEDSGGNTMGSEQKGSGIKKGEMKANEVIRLSSLSNPTDEDGLNSKSAIKLSDVTAQKAGGDPWIEDGKANAKQVLESRDVPMGSEQKGSGIDKGEMKANEVIRASSLSNPADEDGLNLKSAIKPSDLTTQKAGGDPLIEDSKANVKQSLESRDVPMGSEQKGSGIDKGEMKANKVIRLSSLSNLAGEPGVKSENTTLSFDHTIEKTPAHPETGQSERGLLLKLQMALKKSTGEIDKAVIYSDQNRSTGNVNREEPSHNLNNNFRGNGEIIKHPFKNQTLEGVHLKSEPGLPDIESMVKRMDVLKSPDAMSAAKEVELFQKPLQTIVLKQLVDRAAMDLNSGRTAIKINLKPEYLGYLRMEISTENHQVMVKIMTEIPLVKEIIENNINQLKAALAGHGLEMDDLDVFVAHDSDKHEGRNGDTEFTSMENGPAEEMIDDILPDEEHVIQMAAGMSEENLIDFFA
jgi:flagellar hook-length control protein FliK